MDSYGGEEGGFEWFRDVEDSGTDGGSEGDDATEDHTAYVPPEHKKTLRNYVYIDDFNSVEIVDVKNAPMHITTKKTVINAKAVKSERLFSRVNTLASDIGMQVNSQKTQML